jgi:hypothetical protein
MKQSFKIIILPIILILITLVAQFYGSISFNYKISSLWIFVSIIRIFLLIFSFIILLKYFIRLIRSKQFSNRTLNLITSYYMIFLLLIPLELFATLLIYTDAGAEFSISTINWHHIYWNPKNEEGYRDKEFTREKEQLAIFIGDSFTAGFGIKNHKNRYSNLVEKGSDYDCWNMGKSGSNTKDELKLLKELTASPNIIFFQYCLNDMYIPESKPTENRFREAISGFSIPFFMVRSSYLYNNICNYFASTFDKKVPEDVMKAYAFMLEGHMKDLSEINEISQSRNADLVIILFPYLVDLNRFSDLTNAVESLFLSQGVKVINVGNLIKDIPINQRIINKADHHPSALVNKRVANRIIQLLNEDQ